MTVKCIRGKADAGVVDKERADEAIELYSQLYAELEGQNTPRAKEGAGALTTKGLEYKALVNRKAKLQQALAQREVRKRLEKNLDDPLEAALAILDFDPTRRNAGLNVTFLSKTIRGQAMARMEAILDKFGSKYAGTDVWIPESMSGRKASMRAVVRELFGEGSDDPIAKEVAAAMSEGFEYLRKMFNASGGAISKMDRWGLPQGHNRRLIAQVSEEEWVEFTIKLLSKKRMIDESTDLPFAETKLREVLADVYKDIKTDGLHKFRPDGSFNNSIAKRRAQSRFLIFNNADDWLTYQAKFGDTDIFASTMGHINGMSRDVALMRLMGPNPDATLKFMERLVAEIRSKELLLETGKSAARLVGRIHKGQPKLSDLYDVVTGAINTPDSPLRASILAGNRNILTGAYLGGAIFSALSDRVYSVGTETLNGVPHVKVMARMVKMLNPLSTNDRRLATQAGFINDIALGSAIGAQRYIGEIVGPMWTRRIADTTLRLGLLSPWTTWGRNAFALEFLAEFTNHLGRSFDNLLEPHRLALERAGITSADWDLIRATTPWTDEVTGTRILRIHDVLGELSEGAAEAPTRQRREFQSRFDVAMKLQSMVLEEADMAVPQVSARTIAFITAGHREGTFFGDVARNGFLFKSFLVTMVLTHIRRAAFGQNFGRHAKAKYAAQLIIGTTIMGVLGEQLSQVRQGRSPLSLDDTRTWQKGFLRGGGAGIFGDFIFSDINRYGGTWYETVLGPVLGRQGKAIQELTFGSLWKFIEEGETKGLGTDILRIFKDVTPGRSLWWLSLAFERLVFDEIRRMVDPDAAGYFGRVQRRAQREFGQSYFSPPGSGFPPTEMPDLGKLFEPGTSSISDRF